MAKIRETPKKINFLLSINSKWPPRSKSCCLKGVWINVLEALIDQKFIEIDALLMCMCNFNIIVRLYYSILFRPWKYFWCVKYYKAQPYNMEHTLCVCVLSRFLSWFSYPLKTATFWSRRPFRIYTQQEIFYFWSFVIFLYKNELKFNVHTRSFWEGVPRRFRGFLKNWRHIFLFD